MKFPEVTNTDQIHFEEHFFFLRLVQGEMGSENKWSVIGEA